jgi:hypothetical protein
LCFALSACISYLLNNNTLLLLLLRPALDATALQTTEQVQSSKYAFIFYYSESRSGGRHLTEVGCKKVDLDIAIPLKWGAKCI